MEAVYVHIPFCNHICSYCDFPKVLKIDSFVSDYLEALRKEIESSYDGERIKSLYIGGGTPSCLSRKERIRLLRTLEIFNRDPDCEYTIEVNPRDIDDEFLDDIIEYGINRVSIGIESFDSNNLNILERECEYSDIEEKLKKMRLRGLTNINLDLMYAIPGEKLSVLKKDINKLLKLNPTHISTYSLIIEEHTKMKINGEEYINEELDFKMYNTICKQLKKSGYDHYEVSNFAKPGYKSIHNLNYWNNGEYYGFGLGASGYKDGFRYTNTRSIHEYIKGNYRLEENLLTHKDQMDNEIMLGLRKLEGINVDEFFNKYNVNIQDAYPVQELINKGELIYKNGYLFVNPNMIYVMNEILVKLI